MRRRVILRYSPADSERADKFRARWAQFLNAEVEEGQPTEVIDRASEFEFEGAATGSERAKVVVLLVGAGTAADPSLMEGVAEGMKRGDAVVAICITPNATIPEVLHAAGCEVLDWDSPEIPQACERAVVAIRRAPAIIEAAKSAGTGDDECARAPTAVVEGDRVPVPE